jgi:hypothetical protein
MSVVPTRNPAAFHGRVLSHVLQHSPSMRRTAFFLVVLITGLVLLIDKTQQDEVEADPTAQLFEGR